MARTTFGRTVVKTICDVRYVDSENDVQTTTVTLWGNYDKDHAYNPCRRKLNTKGLIIDEVRHQSYYGKMHLSVYDKYCEKENYKEW